MNARSSESRTSVVLTNVRGFTIISIVAFHGLMAYLAYNPAPHPRYFPPPLISDAHRWIGFDVLCAFEYMYMMQFMFLLSGLFVWPSLVRRGARAFVRRRLLRLGIPFVLGVYLMMPLAQLPIYLGNNSRPTWSGFWSEWLALPYWPSGQLWFLWCLLLLDVAAAGVFVLRPQAVEFLGRISLAARDHPVRYFWVLLAASAVGYVPLALIFSPWEWAHLGPFAFQPSFALLYAIYFVAGVGMGVFGIQSSLFGAGGKLGDYWLRWIVIALTGFVFWTIPTALAVQQAADPLTPILNVVAALGFVVASTGACFALAAVFVRYCTAHSPLLTRLSDHAYAIYFFHYGFVLWLQYMLLDLPLIAPLKAAIVITGALLLSFAASAVTSQMALPQRYAKLRAHSAPRLSERPFR